MATTRPPCSPCARAMRASASNAETPISGLPAAIASPCIVAMPTRSPVNDPGPVATAKTSIVAQRDAARARAAPPDRPAAAPPGRASASLGLLAQHAVVAQQRAAARARRRVERQDHHRLEDNSNHEASRQFLEWPRRHHRCPVPPLRHACDASVSRRQAPAPRRHRLLPDGRLLRDVLRGRAGRRARARSDADVALEGRRRRRHPDVRRAVSRGRRLPRASSSARASASPSASRSRIRRRPRGSSSARSCASSRPAR